MIWHESSGPDVAEFAKTCDVALLPVGCVEMHGPQNPTRRAPCGGGDDERDRAEGIQGGSASCGI